MPPERTVLPIESHVFERILCAVDGSPGAAVAVAQARRLLAPGGRLSLAAVVETPALFGPPAYGAPLLAEEAEAAAERALAAAAAAGADRTQVLRGPAVASLLAEVEEVAATLVAAGAPDAGRAAGIILGHVATGLLHDAQSAVLVARPSDAAEFPASVVAGCDGSPSSLRAVAAARALGERFGVSVRVVAATGGTPPDAAGLADAAPVDRDDRDPLHALLAAAEAADLLVLGSRGLHGLAALGSVSERVAHRASCSVLVVR